MARLQISKHGGDVWSLAGREQSLVHRAVELGSHAGLADHLHAGAARLAGQHLHVARLGVSDHHEGPHFPDIGDRPVKDRIFDEPSPPFICTSSTKQHSGLFSEDPHRSGPSHDAARVEQARVRQEGSP